MANTPWQPYPRVHADPADVEAWARLLDEHPAEIERAIGLTGHDLGAVRRFLWSRQLGLDFGPSQAEVAASAAPRSAA